MKDDVRLWMPLYINDYLGDTTSLEATEHGAYLLLIMHYWKNGPLKNNPEELARVARLSRKGKYKTLERILSYFTFIGDEYRHSRIDEEMEKARAKRESARLNGSLGGNPALKKGQPNPYYDKRKVISSDNPGDKRKINSSPTPTPLPKEKKKEREKKEPSPIVEGCVYFRLTEHELVNAQKWYSFKGYPLDLIPLAREVTERWLRKNTAKAIAARAASSHYDYLQATWVIKDALEMRSLPRAMQNGTPSQARNPTLAERNQEFVKRKLEDDYGKERSIQPVTPVIKSLA